MDRMKIVQKEEHLKSNLNQHKRSEKKKKKKKEKKRAVYYSFLNFFIICEFDFKAL